MKPKRRLWRAFEANEVTHSGAHYLLALAALGRGADAPRAVDVARHLGVSRAAVSLQIHALAAQRLVRIGAGNRLHLSRGGADLVARIAGKREVVRVFLQEVLGLAASTAELDACKVEHLLSEEAGAGIVRLVRFLRSAHPAARACLEVFRETTRSCPPGTSCNFCNGVCLLRAGSSA